VAQKVMAHTNQRLIDNLLSEKVNKLFWLSLFDEPALQGNAQFLKQQLGATTSYLNQWGLANVRSAFQNATQHRSLGSAISLYTQFSPPSSIMPEDVGQTMLNNCILSMQHIQQDDASHQYTQIVSWALAREMAPYYISLWEWFAIHAASLANSLWKTYQSNGGRAALVAQYPGFSPVFLTLIDALKGWYQAIPRHKTKKHINATVPCPVLDCEIMSKHFANLKLSEPDKILPKLSIRPRHNFNIPSPITCLDDFKCYHSQLFIEVLYRMLMHPHLSHFYKQHVTAVQDKASSRTNWEIKPKICYEGFKDILLVRGGTLYLLLQAFQTESVFALAPIQNLITKPWNLYAYSTPKRYVNLGKIFAQVSQVDQLIAMVQEALDEQLDLHDWFHPLASDIAQKLYRHTLQLESNRILSDKEFLDSKSLVTPADQQAIIRRGWRIHQSQLDQAELDFNQLLLKPRTSTNSSPVALHLIVVIIHQALRAVRLKDHKWDDTRDSMLNNLQQGRHMHTAKEVHSPDHMNCIREDLGYVQLLRDLIKPDLLHTAIGFVNHFIFFATGQSPQTRDFLMMEPRILHSVQDLKVKLNTAQYVMGMPWNKMENSTMWGTCNDWLSWRGHGHKEEPSKRFARLFDPVQLEVIQKFLDEPADRRTWRATHDWILKYINFPGVNNLTLLQLVNNLAYLGLSQKPTMDELALWVSHNDLGGLAGLEFLEFKKTIGQPRQTRTILMLLYNHLDTYLSNEDKATLHFDTIFFEHLLCKVARWS
jgi:hypothetical protein